MRRREFITLLGSAAAWPLAARAQQPAMPVVGFLSQDSPAAQEPRVIGLRQGLSQSGYVEGRNLTIEYRWAEGRFDQLPELATQLVRRQPAAIFTHGPQTVRILKGLTATIPVVFVMGEDPVKEGLVASFNRPGGNITGLSGLTNQLFAKRVQLLTDTVPKATVLAILVNPNNPNAEPDAKDAQSAAAALGRRLEVLSARTEPDLEPAFVTMVQRQVGGLLVGVDGLFMERRSQLAALAARHAIPAIYERSDFARDGGLMTYSTDTIGDARQAGLYLGRVLKGEKPSDLPVQQSTKFEFVINLKTAKALGLTIQPGLLAIVDEVIE
jgi:putative tryptophan/tyrosine transport system substrate-binding protein